MSSIGTISNSSDLFPINNTQASTAQEQAKVHHHHKPQVQDLIQLSDQSNQDSATQVNPLDSLVTNGTITQAQEGSIMSALMSSMQSNQASGAYSAKQTNPISSLVANGTITQAQAASITDTFKSISQASQDLTQVPNSQETSQVHHHHHTKQTQDTTLTSVLDNLKAKGTITQDQETSIEDSLQTQL